MSPIKNDFSSYGKVTPVKCAPRHVYVKNSTVKKQYSVVKIKDTFVSLSQSKSVIENSPEAKRNESPAKPSSMIKNIFSNTKPGSPTPNRHSPVKTEANYEMIESP